MGWSFFLYRVLFTGSPLKFQAIPCINSVYSEPSLTNLFRNQNKRTTRRSGLYRRGNGKNNQNLERKSRTKIIKVYNMNRGDEPNYKQVDRVTGSCSTLSRFIYWSN